VIAQALRSPRIRSSFRDFNDSSSGNAEGRRLAAFAFMTSWLKPAAQIDRHVLLGRPIVTPSLVFALISMQTT